MRLLLVIRNVLFMAVLMELAFIIGGLRTLSLSNPYHNSLTCPPQERNPAGFLFCATTGEPWKLQKCALRRSPSWPRP